MAHVKAAEHLLGIQINYLYSLTSSNCFAAPHNNGHGHDHGHDRNHGLGLGHGLCHSIGHGLGNGLGHGHSFLDILLGLFDTSLFQIVSYS